MLNPIEIISFSIISVKNGNVIKIFYISVRPYIQSDKL